MNESGMMEAMANSLAEFIAIYPYDVTPYTISQCANAFVQALNANPYLSGSSDMADPFSNATGATLGHVLMQALGHYTDEEYSREFRVKALDAAAILGPDHAQTLYRFAVLVTKLA